MSDRVYKGKLSTIEEGAFSEAAESFNTPHAGQLIPFEVLKRILRSSNPAAPRMTTAVTGDNIIVQRGNYALVISRDGTIEIITAG